MITKVRRDVERSQPFLHRIGEAGAKFGTKPPRSKRVRLAIQLGIAILVFGFLVLTVVDQWSEIKDKGVHFHVLWLIPAFVILPIFYALNAVGWDLILRFLGYRLGAGRAQVAWGQPLLARYVPGSVLYVLGRVLLSERAGVPRRLTVASIVYEQALQATSAIVVAAYFLIDHPDLQGQPLRWAVLLLIPLAIVLLHPRVFGPLANRVLRAFGREPLPAVMSLRRRARGARLLHAQLGRDRGRHLLRRPLGQHDLAERHPASSARRRPSATWRRWPPWSPRPASASAMRRSPGRSRWRCRATASRSPR